MRLFDTHAHFDGFAAEGTVAAVLARAAAAGVGRICAVGSAAAANELVVRLAGERPDLLVAAVGYDRDQLEAPRDLERLAELAAAPGVVAVGEIGLDYYYSAETAPRQRALFGQMLEFALARRLPVIVHSRAADADTVAMLGEFSTAWKIAECRAQADRRRANARSIAPRECAASEGGSATAAATVFHTMEKYGGRFPCHGKKIFPYHGKNHSVEKNGGGPIHPPGILHCFTGDAAFAEELLALGFMISFSGIVSFNNAGPLREVAQRIPADRLLVETDCPYLTPKPFRGKVNEPAYVARVAAVLAEVRGAEAAALAAATFANAERVFQREGRS
jgi:Tat protein secretion system quality control protein TatD with DNase activity